MSCFSFFRLKATLAKRSTAPAASTGDSLQSWTWIAPEDWNRTGSANPTSPPAATPNKADTAVISAILERITRIFNPPVKTSRTSRHDRVTSWSRQSNSAPYLSRQALGYNLATNWASFLIRVSDDAVQLERSGRGSQV